MKKETTGNHSASIGPGYGEYGQPRINLYCKRPSANGSALFIRPVDLERHIGIIHHWANLPYSSRFWQMQGDRASLYEYYRDKVKDIQYRIFFVCLEEMPIALFEVYRSADDEVSRYYDFGQNDYGIHLMMAPYRELLGIVKGRVRGISIDVLITILQYLFTFSSIENIVAEPDSENKGACDLATKVGFSFLKKITMSYKNANLYLFNKEEFSKLHGTI